MWRYTGKERELQKLRGEHSNGLQQTKQRKTQQMVPPCTPKPEMCIHWYRQGPGAETQAVKDRSGTGLGLAVQRQPKGVRER